MKRIIGALLISAAAAAALSQTNAVPSAGASRVPRKSPGFYRNPKAGLLEKRGEGLPILVLDLTGGAGDLEGTKEKMQMFLSCWVDIANGSKEGSALETALQALADRRAGAVIALASDGADAPSLTVCPEDRAAVINVDRLKDGAAPGLVAARLNKEIWRCAALVLGGYASDYPCALKGVNSLADLDKECIDTTCPPVNFKVGATARKLGVAPVGRVPYGVAVRQGWAPPPTNDVQKAVWDRVKAEQSAPAAAPEAL